MKVEDNAFVSMHYRLFDAAGELVEATEESEPVRYLHGNDEILPGLEKALDGAGPGETLRLTLEPGEAYGDYNPEGLVVIPRSELPDEHDYVEGDWISLTVEDDGEEPAQEEGEVDHDGEIEMRIVEARETEIVLDANHPLAGQRVTFEVDVISVESPPE